VRSCIKIQVLAVGKVRQMAMFLLTKTKAKPQKFPLTAHTLYPGKKRPKCLL